MAMSLALLLLLFTFYSCNCDSTNDYLTRATSSLVLSQVKGDGAQTQATAFVVDIVNKTVSQYHDPLTLTDPVSSAAAPALGDWAIYQRIGYCHGQGDKSLQVVYVNETQEKVLSATLEPAVSGNGSCEQLVMADINGDGASEMIALLSDNDADTVEVVAYENVEENEPSQVQSLGKVVLSGASIVYGYKMAAGKIRQGDNKTDLVVVSAFADTSVFLWILGLSSDNQLEAIVSRYEVVNDTYNIYDYCVPMDVVVGYLNDDNGEGTSTLVVAYQESIVGVEVTIALRSYQLTGRELIAIGNVTKSMVSPSAPPVNISLSVGKIQTTTELQSVVMAMGPYNGPFHLYILKAVNGHLDGSTLWTYIGDQTVFSLSHQISAEVLSDTGGGIAVIDSYTTDTSHGQALYLLQVKGDSITGKILKSWTDTDYTHGYVSAGNMIGLDTWLGPETRHTASLLKDVMMILEAPPFHSKFRAQYSGMPSVSWSTFTSEVVIVSMSSTSTYTKSNTLKLSLGLFSSSVSHSIEDSVKNVVDTKYESQVSVKQALEISVTFEDAMLVREISYTVIERPVYIGNKHSGSIVVYQPIESSVNSLSSIVSGSYLYYNTSHVVGDIRTYPFGAPTDIDYGIFSASGTVSFGTKYSFTVTSESMTGQSEALTRQQSSKVTNQVDLKFPFNLEGISGSIGGSYSDSTEYVDTSVNTSSTKLTNQVQISYTIPGYSSTPSSTALQYKVIPYIYWDKAGVFRFRWSVNLPTKEWSNYITKPDPALLLPYSAEVFKNSLIQYTAFELYITPRSVPASGSSIIIALPIHNYSFKPATNTSIEFYWASASKLPPDFNSTTDWHHIGTEHIPSIGGFLNETVFIPWIPDSGLKSAVIIVNVVAGSAGDFDTSNNMGYSVWPQDDNNPFREISLLRYKRKKLLKDEL